MYKKVFVTILILFILYTCYVVKSQNCPEIHWLKGFTNVMQKAISKYKAGTESKTLLCSLARNFTYALFHDPATLGCTKYIISFLKQHRDVWGIAQKECQSEKNGYIDFLACGSIGLLDICILDGINSMHLNFSKTPSESKVSCKNFCRNADFVVVCARDLRLDHRCPRVFKAMKTSNISAKWCNIKICKQSKNNLNWITPPRGETISKPTVSTTKGNDKNQDDKEKLSEKTKAHGGNKTTKRNKLLLMIAGGATFAIVVGLIFTLFIVVHYRTVRSTVDHDLEVLALTGGVCPTADPGPATSVQNDTKDRLSTPSNVVSASDDPSSSIPSKDIKRKRRKRK